jgi:hypothetical protein
MFGRCRKRVHLHAALYVSHASKSSKICSAASLLQIDKAPELIRPHNCTRKAFQLRDPANEPNVNSWLPVCRTAQQECSATASRAAPWLKCTYTSLSTFWEIQRWIRNNGAVVTR